MFQLENVFLAPGERRSRGKGPLSSLAHPSPSSFLDTSHRTGRRSHVDVLGSQDVTLPPTTEEEGPQWQNQPRPRQETDAHCGELPWPEASHRGLPKAGPISGAGVQLRARCTRPDKEAVSDPGGCV